ncbi:XRE family transcriptional regulator, partial [Listeria monocytogenes]|nr:XRE family transcriptional regulator [Listeria monocytogenes]
MDIQKIGEFLRKLRKQNNMTQEQLGERLHVTNKTVSRWETGKYMPPIECLKLLSDIYQISVNEILTGGNLDEEDFKEAAENNISDTLEEIEAKGKKFENTIFIIMGLTSLLAIFSMFLLPNGSKLTGMEKVKEIIVV